MVKIKLTFYRQVIIYFQPNFVNIKIKDIEVYCKKPEMIWPFGSKMTAKFQSALFIGFLPTYFIQFKYFLNFDKACHSNSNKFYIC